MTDPTKNPDHWKLYQQAVETIGARTEPRALVAVVVLVLLFLGFILPSQRNIEQVARLRADGDRNTRLMRRIDAREKARTWGVTRASFAFEDSQEGLDSKKLEDLTRQLEAGGEPEGLSQLQWRCAALAEGDTSGGKALDKACKLLAAYNEKRARVNQQQLDEMRRLNKSAQEALDTALEQKDTVVETAVERTVVKAAGRLPELCENEVSNLIAEEEQREQCRQYALLRYRAVKAQTDLRLEKLMSSQLSLKFLGLFGVQADDLDDLQVPLLYIPVTWSIILLVLLIYAGSRRNVMLNLYARAVRARLAVLRDDGTPPTPGEIADELGGVPHSPWWWLAPLPGRNGERLDREKLRDALGWKSFHFAASLGVWLSLGTLLAMQVAVLVIGAQLTFAFTDGVDAIGPMGELAAQRTWDIWLVVPLLLALTLVNLVLVVRWLWPWTPVLDRPPAEAETSRFRRLAVGVLVLSALGLALPLLRTGPKRPTAALLKPLKRFRQKKGPRRVEAGSLAQGFYLNPASGSIHYVVPAVPEGARASTRHHTRRKRRRKEMIRLERQHHRALVAAWRDGQGAFPKQERTEERGPASSIPPLKAQPARIRHTGRMPRRELVPVAAMDLFTTPPGEQLVSPKGKLVKRHLNPGEKVFAIEQEALRLLRDQHIDEACQFLQLALANRRPGDRSMLRLFDVLAIISVTRKRDQVLAWLIATAEQPRPVNEEEAAPDKTPLEPGLGSTVRPTGQPTVGISRFGNKEPPKPSELPELAQRVRSWKNPDSAWHRRWSKQPDWTGLPT